MTSKIVNRLLIIVIWYSFLLGQSVFAQHMSNDCSNLHQLRRYDLVAYFENHAIKGKKNITFEYNGVKLRFISTKHRDMFSKNPEKYLPQYGGFCAYAIAESGKHYRVNPKSFKIIEGKIYLFYHNFFYSALRRWNSAGNETMILKGNRHWSSL